jgi:hypothetical protein
VWIVDFYFVVPAGSGLWGKDKHEPLMVGLYLPLLRHSPWDWRKVPFLVGLSRKMSAVFKADFEEGSDLLREFWAAALWVQNMPKLLVSDLLSDSHYRRFLGVAKKGSGNG